MIRAISVSRVPVVGPPRITRAGRGIRSDPEPSLRPEEVATTVTIGGSIALIVIGAILKWGITWHPQNIDLQVIGLILMIAGVVGLIIAITFQVLRRRQRASAQVYEERRYTQPPP
jgi:hypothetical protein